MAGCERKSELRSYSQQPAGDFRNRVLLCKVDLEQPEETLEQALERSCHAHMAGQPFQGHTSSFSWKAFPAAGLE